jgi:hypothetical protein
MEHISGALIVIAVLGFIALIIKWVGMGKWAESQRMFETQKQILDKIGSGPEMLQFLSSDEGKAFFERLKMSPQKSQANSDANLGGVVTMIAFGFVGTGIGIGLLIASLSFGKSEYIVTGCTFTCVGILWLIGTWIGYRLGVKWGIIRKGTEK